MSESAFRERYGPLAIVTGGAMGIGRGFARRLATRGLDLLIADLDRLDAALGDDSTAGAQKKNARPKRKAARGKARSRN